MSTRQIWLPAKIAKGMFSDERTVTIELAGTQGNYSVFVPASEVDETQQRVRVDLFQVVGDLALLGLPDSERSLVHCSLSKSKFNDLGR